MAIPLGKVRVTLPPAAVSAAQNGAPQLIPFVAAAHEHSESAPAVSKLLVAAGAPTTFEFNVPSYGYARHVWLLVQATGGAGVAANPSADSPWNALGNVTFLDTNGAPILGPLSGYQLFLANLFGGYVYAQDPRDADIFSPIAAAGTGNFAFALRIPLEISHHDGTGAIGNQNASAPYRIRLDINPPETIYANNPTTMPTVTVTPVLEAWSLPNNVDGLGRPQAQLPPNYGTVQYWSARTMTGLVIGNNTVQILRVGNLIRQVILVGRTAAGVRSDTVLPDPAIVNFDQRQLFNEPLAYRRTRTLESQETKQAQSAQARPTGVITYTYSRTNQDRNGDDKPWLWLPSVEATRLEITGTWAAAGNMEIVINDIAPAEVNPTKRYVENNATGFHPSSAPNNPSSTQY